MKNVLICANPDLNLIDGSSVWAQTITLAMARTGVAQVDFLAKSAPTNHLLFKIIENEKSVRVINGTNLNFFPNSKPPLRLNAKQMIDVTLQLDDKLRYDIVIVRGFDIAKKIIPYRDLLSRCWIYLTDIEQDISLINKDDLGDLAAMAESAQKVLCQSSGFVDLWKKIAPKVSENKFVIYSPVTLDPGLESIPISLRPQRAVYAGKFKSDWNTLEMVKLWPNIVEKIPRAEFVVIGDKIHKEQQYPLFFDKMNEALQNTAKLFWAGAMSREDTMAEFCKARVGVSWRNSRMDKSLEYSTKILEYGASGCAVVLNRNSIHDDLLGMDYPLFANSDEEFINTLIIGLSDIDLAQEAANRMKAVALKHSLSERVSLLSRWIKEASPIRSHIVAEEKNCLGFQRRLRVLVAGHDLKFFKPLQKRLEKLDKFEFVTDEWGHHNKHDEQKSRQLLQQADIIFCEWCLGNFVWYSNNKLPHQKLIARFHSQERNTSYIEQVNYSNVDHISFVNKSMMASMSNRMPLKESHLSFIPNYLDYNKFHSIKKIGDTRFALGMIGIVPETKRLDRALDLLEKLLEHDKRYHLRIKGKVPFEYGWIQNRPEELKYFMDIMERVNSNENLRYNVIFDPPGDDVEKWLELVGIILSPSDFESFHMAIGEGMLMNCFPVIWNWEGADTLWPTEYIVSSIDEAIKKIIKLQFTPREVESLREFVFLKHNPDAVVNSWVNLLTF